MTIIEKTIGDIIVAVQQEKKERRIEPTHALFLADALTSRIVDALDGCGIKDQSDAKRALDDMAVSGLLVTGPTMRDTYYTLPPVEYDSIL